MDLARIESLGAAAREAIRTHAIPLWSQAVEIWIAGGWAMAAIAAVALLMFGVGARIGVDLRAKTRRRGGKTPLHRAAAEIALLPSFEEADAAFKGLRTTELAPFERNLRVMKVCVAAAPLLGLFGTVTGMLATFGALATGTGGDKTVGLIAKGIAEALITTETGLVVALPGLFYQYRLARGVDRYRAAMAHAETVAAQALMRRLARAEAAARRAHGATSAPAGVGGT